MEIKKTCPGRTWKSMRHRWMKYISKKLGKFRVTMEELEKRDGGGGMEGLSQGPA